MRKKSGKLNNTYCNVGKPKIWTIVATTIHRRPSFRFRNLFMSETQLLYSYASEYKTALSYSRRAAWGSGHHGGMVPHF